MGTGSIVFVHGTGVRLAAYRSGFTQARRCAENAEIDCQWVDCVWGDPWGVQFQGKSLPDPSSLKQLEAEGQELAQWSWLFADPLTELERLTIRPEAEDTWPQTPEWLALWDRLEAYQPSPDLRALLIRGGLAALWPTAWHMVVRGNEIARQAFKCTPRDEFPEAGAALARALVAQLHVLAQRENQAGPSRELRQSIVMRLKLDWGVEGLAPSDFFAGMLKRAATAVMRRHRNDLMEVAIPAIGDILLYQSRGHVIREFIRNKINVAPPPVTVVAHSLGGVACVDLVALPDGPEVSLLVTAGSQAPLFYELDALSSLRYGEQLPAEFPSWLNFYDRNDVLSFVAGELFECAVDVPVESGQPFPDAHSAYYGNAEVWSRIGAMVGR